MTSTRYLNGATGSATQFVLTTFVIAATLAVIVATTPAADASGYYRWTDQQGQTHYSQNPPPDRAAEFVRTSTGTRSPGPDSTQPQPQAQPQPDDPAPGGNAEGESLQGLPEKDPAICQQAREAIESLNGYARIRARQPDGSYKVLTEADKAEQRRLAEEAIEIHCP